MADTIIAEMAVDRLSRNLQFNQGDYKMDDILVKFIPKI